MRRFEYNNDGTWEFDDGIKVEECEFDYDLHCFKVYDGDRFLGTIYPDCVESQRDCVRSLNNGENPIEYGWEDGYGHTCTRDGWSEK